MFLRTANLLMQAHKYVQMEEAWVVASASQGRKNSLQEMDLRGAPQSSEWRWVLLTTKEPKAEEPTLVV